MEAEVEELGGVDQLPGEAQVFSEGVQISRWMGVDEDEGGCRPQVFPRSSTSRKCTRPAH